MDTATPHFTCVIDQSDHPTIEALHKHLRKLKVKQEDYYTKFAPRRDRYTGEPIPFRLPVADYLRREFKDRVTLKRFLKDRPEEGREWTLNWFEQRVREKGLTRAPSQVELRSIPSPAPDIRYFDFAFDGGYAATCDWLQLPGCRIEKMPEYAPPPGLVVIDTREQKPLPLDVPFTRGTLRSADYGLSAEYDQEIYVERKSLNDLCGTLSDRETRIGDSNLARFSRELERITEIGAYVVMVIEAPLDQCLAFNHIPYLKRQMSKVRITPEHVFHNLRDLLQQYSCFQAVFVADRNEAAKAVQWILGAGPIVKNVDLQLQYDLKNWNLAT